MSSMSLRSMELFVRGLSPIVWYYGSIIWGIISLILIVTASLLDLTFAAIAMSTADAIITIHIVIAVLASIVIVSPVVVTTSPTTSPATSAATSSRILPPEYARSSFISLRLCICRGECGVVFLGVNDIEPSFLIIAISTSTASTAIIPSPLSTSVLSPCNQYFTMVPALALPSCARQEMRCNFD